MGCSSVRFSSIFFAVWMAVLIPGTARSGFAGSAPVDTWSSGAPMPTPRFGAAFGVIKKKVYVVSGATASAVVSNNEIYNPATDTWTTGAPIPTPRYVPASAVVKNILYVIGGCNSGCTQGTGALTVVEAYNPATDAWTTKSPMPVPTDSVYAIAAKNIIYVVGGYVEGSGRVPSVYAYNPATDTWTQEASMKVGKSNAELGNLGGIIAAGGFGNGGDTTDTESYSSGKNAWKTIAAMPTALTGGCFGVISGKFYIASGSQNNVAQLATEAYVKSTKSWATGLAQMPQPLIVPASGVVKGRLYCIGGGNSGLLFQGTPYANVQIYQP